MPHFSRCRGERLDSIEWIRTRVAEYTLTVMIFRSKQHLDHQINASSIHEVTHLTLHRELERTSVPTENHFVILGNTRFCDANPCMQGDSIHKPCGAREKESDWPTIIFDSCLSQALTRLRVDAKWCLTNFGGELRLVIIFSITSVRRNLRIEKWCLRTATHANATKVTPNSKRPNTCITHCLLSTYHLWLLSYSSYQPPYHRKATSPSPHRISCLC